LSSEKYHAPTLSSFSKGFQPFQGVVPGRGGASAENRLQIHSQIPPGGFGERREYKGIFFGGKKKLTFSSEKNILTSLREKLEEVQRVFDE
jgi:hypothetical protein